MNKITLSDGRTLAYKEYGDPKGKPLFYFHGWPASRLSGKLLDKPAKKLGLRIISPDRPGFGYSDFQKNRKLLDWPDDVIELANHLKLKKFSIIGASGGAPNVLSCAYKIPDRLSSITITGGLGPIYKMKKNKKLTLGTHPLLFLSPHLTNFLHFTLPLLNITLMHMHTVYVKIWLFNKPKPDLKVIKKTSYQKAHINTVKESLRQGLKGATHEAKLFTKDWGFELSGIKKEVNLWHGELDKNVPIWMGKYVTENLPNCKSHFLKDSGHFLLASCREQILSDAIQRFSTNISINSN